MNPIHLNNLKPHELKQIAAEKPLILVPIGTTEWHTDHLPVGVDALLSQATCDEISSATGCVVAPNLGYGIAENLPPEGGCFGTVDTIRPETLTNLLLDLGAGYAKMGFKIAVLISGHFETGHYTSITAAMENSKDIDMRMLMAHDFTGHLVEEKDTVEETWPFATDHAAEWETSMMLHYYPELVDMSIAPETIELPMPGLPEYIRVRYPRRANAEYGRQLAQAVTDGGVKKINELLNSL